MHREYKTKHKKEELFPVNIHRFLEKNKESPWILTLSNQYKRNTFYL